ncbi:prickle-like protein 4 [Puma concolor]|uniref:Prickle-like protein 4 n=1 Tax=Puma concolor TaxID=9696 RepID=A0A6P6I3L3_PUMCO|nr:prickle-like protein 4 [Puma concolor]
MSVLNSGWPHRGESLTPWELGPPADSDTDPGHLPKEDPEETSEQDPEILSLGLPGLDTNWAPSQPGLRILLQQLPPQDSDERYCLALGEDELAELRLFCAQRRREALGQGVALLVPPELPEHTCEKCRERLRPGEYGVFAARAGERRYWHRACFACQACGQALINLIYFYHDGSLYCGRHHAELLRPRCPACDQVHWRVGTLRWAFLTRPGTGEAGVDRVEERDRTPLDAATVSRAALLAAAPRSSLETQRELLGSSPRQQRRTGDKVEAPTGREQGRLETPLDACPTCSSSDSEPEGFFLGQRLPGPWKTPRSLQAGDSDTSRKHCTIC